MEPHVPETRKAMIAVEEGSINRPVCLSIMVQMGGSDAQGEGSTVVSFVTLLYHL